MDTITIEFVLSMLYGIMHRSLLLLIIVTFSNIQYRSVFMLYVRRLVSFHDMNVQSAWMIAAMLYPIACTEPCAGCNQANHKPQPQSRMCVGTVQ